MLALVIAASLAGQPVVAAPDARPGGDARFSFRVTCPPLIQQTKRTSDRGPSRLDQLPKADLHHLVDRTAFGCRAPSIVRRDVEGDGRAPSPRGQ